MKIKRTGIRSTIADFIFGLYCRIENNNNTDFDKNGERKFIDDLIGYWGKKQRSELIVFDIGANVGGYTRILLEITTKGHIPVKIHVFEPTQACFDQLEHLFSAFPDVVLNRSAVSDANGTAEIYYDHTKSSLASFYKRDLSAYSIRFQLSEIVATTRLDSYIEKKNIPHIDLLKIDIEGHELAAFRGMGRYLTGQYVDFIQFEYGGANLDSRTSLMELYQELEKAGFVVAKLMPRGLDIRPYQPRMDNFQYANYVAISGEIVDRLG